MPPIVCMAVIFHFSAQSDPLPEVTGRVWDKALHVTAYGVLGMLFCRAFSAEGLGWFASIALAVVATTLYGASDEWHQAFVPLRESSIRDWYADLVGALIGSGVYAVVVSTVSRPRRPLRH